MRLEIKIVLHRNVIYSDSLDSWDFPKPRPSDPTGATSWNRTIVRLL